VIRFLCGALRIFAASALKWPLNAETQRLRRRTAEKIHPKNSLFVQSLPAEDLLEFNANIVGPIEVIAGYRNEK